MLQKVGPLAADVHVASQPVATVVLCHGLGLGPWFWEPWVDTFVQRNLSVVALEMPGHGQDRTDVGLQEIVAGIRGALDTLTGPIVLIGHSAMALATMLAAEHRELRALILLCPMPPRQIPIYPTAERLRGAARLLPAVASGKPVQVPWKHYHAWGLKDIEEGAARVTYDRITPWPNKLTRELIRPPAVDPDAVTAPVLTALGKKDRLVPWDRGRILGDLYEGVVWRYDDLGHMPPQEPTGLRMGRDLARFALEPARPVVIESEGFMPTEGVGHDKRKARRGEMMKKRSAYGQKKAAR